VTTPVLPGVEVRTSTIRAPGGPATSTGVAHVVGTAADGPIGEPRPVASLAEFTRIFGARQATSLLHDWLETFFSIGGRLAYVVREDVDAVTGATTDATLTAALDALDPLLGPGQVASPGRTTGAAHTALLAHADARNRWALLDAADLATVAALTGAADAAATAAGASRAQLMDTWFTIPGLTAGTTRAVPGSAVLAGRLAVNDAERDSGEFPAGDNVYGRLPYVLGRTAPKRSEADHAALNGAGVVVTRPGLLGGPLVVYGARSLDRSIEWHQATAGRTRMDLEWELRVVTEQVRQFRKLDGQGLSLSDWAGALRGVCARFYSAGQLFGETPDEAYVVDVGPGVNPPEQLAQGIADANVDVKLSPISERSRINVAFLPIGAAA
jgi:hypothetical protein